ncbi:collagen alpha-1(I) chain-like [Vulpes lagopus]|uniref:collagen alpha-1(I) chain-like n=1 Tax=Vulpes lagopus TaxID=494514 RepID=UPI001BC8EA26|nr:collagen alpha-1(I) chain-like [Vulpes lagopus]
MHGAAGRTDGWLLARRRGLDRGGRRRAGPRLRSRRPPRTLGAQTSPPSRAHTAASGAPVPAPEGSPKWRGAPAYAATRFHPGSARSHCPLGASQRPAPRTGAGWDRLVGGPGPCRGCLLPRELGAGPRADATGRGPRWPRPRAEGGAAGAPRPLPREPPGSAGSSGSSIGEADGRSFPGAGRGRGPRPPRLGPGRGTRSRRSSRRCRGPTLRAGGGPSLSGEERACAPRWLRLRPPRGLRVPGEALDAAPEPPYPRARPEEAKNPDSAQGVGHLRTRAPAAAKPREAPGAPGSRGAERRVPEKQPRARQPGVLPRGPEEQAPAAYKKETIPALREPWEILNYLERRKPIPYVLVKRGPELKFLKCLKVPVTI